MDSRFHLKVELHIYGETYHWAPSLNWSPGDSSDVDQRIIDWFANCYRDARDKYYDALQDDENKHKEKAEQQERSELARLKAKYETSS